MKFNYYNDLLKYLKEKNKDNFISLEEIYDGGSSYNFYLRTTENDYFLKVLETSAQKRITKMMSVLALFYTPEQLNLDEFTVHKTAYNIISMPYIEGHKLTGKQFTASQFTELINIYQRLQTLSIPKEYIYEPLNIIQIKNDIENILSTSQNVTYKIINYLFWRKFSKQIISLPPTQQIIHGDFTMKNILKDKFNHLHLIDFELLRRGYVTEDWATLLLQLSGFSKMWGNLSYFKKLYEQTQTICSDDKQWLYGVQIYYIERLRRRLTDKRKKSKFRKNLCFLCSLMSYFIIAKTIQR